MSELSRFRDQWNRLRRTSGLLIGAAAILAMPGLSKAQPSLTFSLDIGSDSEMSDPTIDGNEWFDPGDVYISSSTSLAPFPAGAAGSDGILDDAFIFAGGDPVPDPPYTGSPVGVPVGSACAPAIACYPLYFDLDGHDLIDVDLRSYINRNQALQDPITDLSSSYIHTPEFLLISYDDDRARGWPSGNVPVDSPSPAGVSSYGETATVDEVLLLTTVPALGDYGIAGLDPFADETGVHVDLTPNPDAGSAQDDDVDALDLVPADASASYWCFSADHEATAMFMGAALDPGDIYLATAAGPVMVVDDQVHLGLPAPTDVDAFEFAFVERAAGEQGYIDGTGAVTEIDPPPSVEAGDLESSTSIPIFVEKTVHTLSAAVTVDITDPGTYDASSPTLTPGTIEAGTTVNSYFLHADRAGIGLFPVTLSGSVYLDEEILGVIVSDANLDASDAELGAESTSYPTGKTYRGLELSTYDGIELVGSSTLHLDLQLTTVVDQVRIITRSKTEAALAVLFSVDDNDPLTAVNESGGRNPNMIYYSFFDGAHHPLFDPAAPELTDDIDGIAAWSESPAADPRIGANLPATR